MPDISLSFITQAFAFRVDQLTIQGRKAMLYRRDSIEGVSISSKGNLTSCYLRKVAIEEDHLLRTIDWEVFDREQPDFIMLLLGTSDANYYFIAKTSKATPDKHSTMAMTCLGLPVGDFWLLGMEPKSAIKATVHS